MESSEISMFALGKDPEESARRLPNIVLQNNIEGAHILLSLKGAMAGAKWDGMLTDKVTDVIVHVCSENLYTAESMENFLSHYGAQLREAEKRKMDVVQYIDAYSNFCTSDAQERILASMPAPKSAYARTVQAVLQKYKGMLTEKEHNSLEELLESYA